MSIKDFVGKIKPHLNNIKNSTYSEEGGLKIHNDIYIVLILILVGTASYGLGVLSSYERSKAPISIRGNRQDLPLTASVLESINKTTGVIVNNGEVVASKSGTRYYYPNCSGVSRIKEENKVWYKSITDAEAKGLTLASGCNK